MIIKRNMAVDSLTRVCEESLALIKQLIDADHAVYGKGFEDGMAAQAKVQHTLKPWVGLTDEERDYFTYIDAKDKARFRKYFDYVEAKLKEKNT